MRWLFLILLFIAFCSVGQSSVRSADTTGMSASYARVGLRYKSDYYYMGRADSARVPYLVPTFGYYHKSGFFVSSSLSYLLADGEGRVDLFSIGAGYDYYGRKFATGLAVDKYFFSEQSYSVQAEMNTYLSAYIGYDFNWFLMMLDASLGVSQSTDIFVGGEVSRAFYMFRNKVSVTPGVSFNMGTQHYYNEYYTNRSITTGSGGGGGHGQGPGSGSGSDSTIVITEARIRDAEKFQVLDYEASLQVAYRINQFRIIVGATLLFPVNPSTIITDQYTYKEDLDIGKYWSIALRYTIK